jgi:sugar phosphate isomerase/epimerase
MLKPHIAYYHIKDADTATGKAVPAGQGSGDIEVILKQAIANGYDGFLSLEPHLVDFAGLAALEVDPHKHNSTMSGEEAFRIAHSALTTILRQIGG